MAYINLKEVTSKNNKDLDMTITSKTLRFSARKDMILGLQCNELVFLNIKLFAGNEIRYVEGDSNILVVDGNGNVLEQKAPDYLSKNCNLQYAMEYQRYYPEEKFAVVPKLHYTKEDKEVRLYMLSFMIYPNDGKFKSGPTISIDGPESSRTPLAILLKKAHKRGATMVHLRHDLIEFFMPEVGPVPIKKKKGKEVREVWSQILGSDSKDTEWLISKFGIEL